jgi:hypothetical protein
MFFIWAQEDEITIQSSFLKEVVKGTYFDVRNSPDKGGHGHRWVKQSTPA